MEKKRNCIVVFFVTEKNNSRQNTEDQLLQQKERLSKFLFEHSQIQLVADYYETVKTQKNKNKWPKMQEALLLAQKNNYEIIIPEIKQNHGHTLLSNILINTYKNESAPLITFLDQPFINKSNLLQIIEHLIEKRKKHGSLIKEGLTRSTSKSGNPKASEIIHRVNRPKILFSILFSLIIEPIVNFMEQKNYSQRKMVAFLNQNGFSAPEGGIWVLSQFQKVYDRVKLNKIAFAVQHRVKNKNINQALIDDLNISAAFLLPKNKSWSTELIQSVLERLNDVQELALLLKAKNELSKEYTAANLEMLSVQELLNNKSLNLSHFSNNKLASSKTA